MPEDQSEGQQETESGQTAGTAPTSSVTGKEVKSVADNQGTDDQTKSNQADSEAQKSESKQQTYKLPDGREVSADELHQEYTEKLLPEFTRRSQELAKLKKAQEEVESRAKGEAQKAVSEDEVLSQMPPDVQEVLTKFTDARVKGALEEYKAEQRRAQQDAQFEQTLGELEGKYDGSDGLPKFDKQKVVRAMQEPDNKIFDPEAKFRDMHRDEFMDVEIKKAMKQKSGGTATEKTGSQTTRKPESKTPKSFQEAKKRALSRM